MKSFVPALFVFAFGLGFALVVSATTEQLRGEVAGNFTRACRFGADNLQYVTATGSATSTTSLQGGTRYRMFCSTATYFDQGASGGSDAATSADAQVAANTVQDIWTKSGDFVSLRAVASAGVCDVLECQ
jgi:hypothetical protein